MPRKVAASPVFEAPEPLPVMQDEPFDLAPNLDQEGDPPRKRHEDEPDDPNHPVPGPDNDGDDPDPHPDRPPKEPDEIVSAGTRYESRIQILDAFQYPGTLTRAPAWVDRNWIGFGDYDQLRGIEPGPCLRVPLPSGVTALCRVGDYVCRQSVTLVQGNPAEIRLEVWQQEHFVKMFVPSLPNTGSSPLTSTRQPTPSPPDASPRAA